MPLPAGKKNPETAASDDDWREWIAACDLAKCRESVQQALRQCAVRVGNKLLSDRKDIGAEFLGAEESLSERFWHLFETYIQAGHVLQRGDPPPGTTWHSLSDKTKAYKHSLGQAGRGLSAYASHIMRSAFLHFASGESCRRIRPDGKLRTLHRRPLDFLSLDAPVSPSGDATLLDVLTDSDSAIPGVAAICATIQPPPEEPPAGIMETARQWADSEFQSLSQRKNKTVLMAIAAVAMGIPTTDPRLRQAAGVSGKSSVASALSHYLQRIADSDVFSGMSENLKIQTLRVGLRFLTAMAVAWAAENHLFSPGIVPPPPSQ